MRGGAWRAAGRACFAALVGLLGLGASAPADLRSDLEAIGLALDRAVLQVSRPSRAAAPRTAARGYRLAGFGAMFVLAPRALPVPPPSPTPEEREIARELALAAQELERRLPQVSDDMRRQLQSSLRAMRQTEAELRLRERMARRAAGDAVAEEGGTAPAPRSLDEQLVDLERDVQMMQRLQTEAVRAVRDETGIPLEMRREIEAHMRLVNEQAEAFAAEADRARQEAERVIWYRLGQQPPSPGAPAAAPPPADRPPDGTPPSFLSPWPLWIDPMVDATPDPEGVIKAVGAAVTGVLEKHGARLRALTPQDVVAVAIDFVPATRGGVRARPARTLLVRAKKADIDLRTAGQITPTEFRRRVEYVEY